MPKNVDVAEQQIGQFQSGCDVDLVKILKDRRHDRVKSIE